MIKKNHHNIHAAPLRRCVRIFLLLLVLISCSREKKSESIIETPPVNIEIAPVQQEYVAIKPIPANADAVLKYPKENWRNADYEVFIWEEFADAAPILIFDYADYAVQDKMLKRLAFFAEKAGFRGRLAHDSEIAHLHGWNAHDYRAQDLARFFDTARSQQFPLLEEEWELENILLSQKIIFKKTEQGIESITAGKGAVISISQESPDYLRRRFMAHEGFHALYFIDEDFRSFCRDRWEIFPAPAKKFLLSYFDYQQYDTSDEYLLLNEFMGHILQQPVSQAAEYFGKNLTQRLENTWRKADLPQKDEATGAYPALADAFAKEAQAFSDYVNQRWGFAAGRVW